jgi:hypothetical protein
MEDPSYHMVLLTLPVALRKFTQLVDGLELEDVQCLFQ